MQRYLVLPVVGEQLAHHLVVAGQCNQFVHSPFDVGTAHQPVQLFAWVSDGLQYLDLNAGAGVMGNLALVGRWGAGSRFLLRGFCAFGQKLVEHFLKFVLVDG